MNRRLSGRRRRRTRRSRRERPRGYGDDVDFNQRAIGGDQTVGVVVSPRAENLARRGLKR